MIRFVSVLAFLILHETFVDSYTDLIPEAITVYRNPEFFKKLNYGTKTSYNQKPTTTTPPQGGYENYKYPGETKKSNPPPDSPGFEVNYDNSPEFHHEPREIFVDTTYKPKMRKGPYAYKQNENNLEQPSKYKKPAEVKETDEEETDSRENAESSKTEPEPREFVSVLNEEPEEEFRNYHEPILLARPSFDSNSGFASSTYSQPYPFNRSSPILYEDWKFYNYPLIHSKGHLKSGSSRIYSEEPPSNSFESDETPYYGKFEHETEDQTDLFDSTEFKNLGADTKHIYKKLLNPKKSFLFKFHSKPKFKKLKLKLKKKKHLHHTDWFDEYPFDF